MNVPKFPSSRIRLFPVLIWILNWTLLSRTGTAAPLPRVRITAKGSGIVRISFESLKKLGWIGLLTPVRNFRMYSHKGEKPIRITGEGDGRFDENDCIEFWTGPEIHDPNRKRVVYPEYRGKQIFWLEAGNKRGIRMALEEDYNAESDRSTAFEANVFSCTAHVERDLFFHRLPWIMDQEEELLWFYDKPVQAGEVRTFPFQLSSVDTRVYRSTVLRMELRGLSRSTLRFPVDVYLNDRYVFSGEWSGLERLVLESPVFGSALLYGQKQNLTLANRYPGEEISPFLLDWFEVDYQASYRATDDCLHFFPPEQVGPVHYILEGFSSSEIEIYKKDVSWICGVNITVKLDSLGMKTYQASFYDAVTDPATEYMALVSGKKLKPESMILAAPAAFPDRDGADQIIIVAGDSMREDIEELIRHRKNQGVAVEIIDLMSLYNTFSSGIPGPEAIKTFLQYVRHNWHPGPRSVLLVGDGSIVRPGTEEKNSIPVPLVQTYKYGATPSDHWYVLLDGDDAIPDMAIGRLPVRSRQELRTLVRKILDYERSPPDPWMNRMVFIASGTGNHPFVTQSDELISKVIHPGFESNRFFLDIQGKNTSDLVSLLEKGALFVNFRGHGGGGVWADSRILTFDDAGNLRNGVRLPVVTSMTCFTGDYTLSHSLGEEMVLLPDGGAVAFWGSTGVGWIWNDHYLVSEFYRQVCEHPDLTLGQMIQTAKTFYLAAHSGSIPLSEVHQYTLLGDPELRLHIPDGHALHVQNRVLGQGEPVILYGESPYPLSRVLLELTNEHLERLWDKEYGFQEKQEFRIPDGLSGTVAGLRLYQWDPEAGYHSHSFTELQIGKALFSGINTLPYPPDCGDPVTLIVKIEPESVSRVVCMVESPLTDTIPMIRVPPGNTYLTERSLPPFHRETALFVHFIAQGPEDLVSTSDRFIVQIPGPTDLFLGTVSLGGIQQVELEAAIGCAGKTCQEPVPVRFSSQRASFSVWDTVSIPATGMCMASVPFPSLSGEMDVAVSIDPENRIYDSNRKNNGYSGILEVNRFNVTPLGSLDGTQPGPVGIPGYAHALVPGDALRSNSVLRIEKTMHRPDDAADGDTCYPDVHFILEAFPDNHMLLRNATLSFISRENKRPYRWVQNMRSWAAVQYERKDSVLTVKTPMLGRFRLFASQDISPPRIDIGMMDQDPGEGSYIPQDACFTVVLQDESGLFFDEERIRAVLDGCTLDRECWILPDSVENTMTLVLGLKPDLSTGDHTLYVEAEDIHGNRGKSKEIRFRVREAFELQYLGNHPNPFQSHTVFVYVLTLPASRASLRIYTVSGRLIRCFENTDMTGADYHELIWDGCDSDGNPVANGVYFFLFEVMDRSSRKQVKGKIARIR